MGLGQGEFWATVLRGMSDEQLDAFVEEFTETLPADDPMIEHVRTALYKLRDGEQA
jgi:hypothetical protein